MKKIKLLRIFFVLISLVIVGLGLFIEASNLMAGIIGTLVTLALVVFDINAPKIAKLSEDNPKVKTMQRINRFTMLIVIAASVFAVYSPSNLSTQSKSNELIIIGLVSVAMMIFGNVAPKIPFNRYLGFRLPWTIRDEDTWKVAHKFLGYLSFPIAILVFIFAIFFNTEIVATVGILTWIVIPGLYSLWFYYNKYSTSKAK